jgi:L-ascorbate metabolism protein UlaG (beta-lactamase superfamily)
MVERVVDAAALDFIDVTTSSHGHTDHQDPETLRALLCVNPEMPLVIPAASLHQCSERVGVPESRLTSIDEGTTIEIGPFAITAVASAHESIEYNEKGACMFLGYVLRFGAWTLYHAGDTVDYPGLAERLRAFGVDLALLPINGRGKGVPGNLDATEAAQLARRMGARMAIPCHYDMFKFNTVDPLEFSRACALCSQPCVILAVGERYLSPIRLPARRRIRRDPRDGWR